MDDEARRSFALVDLIRRNLAALAEEADAILARNDGSTESARSTFLLLEHHRLHDELMTLRAGKPVPPRHWLH